MTVNTVWHFLVHSRCVRFAMTGPACRYIRMITPVAEGTGECLVLGCGLFHLCPDLFVAGHAESSRGGHGRQYLQRMMGRVAAKTVTG